MLHSVFKRVTAVIITVTLLLCLVPLCTVAAESDGQEIKILFTHDIHDHYSPHEVTGYNELLGGYARLSSAISENKTDNTLLVDAGDFSMGSVIQTVFEESAPTLSILGMLGYNAVTLGNHEFDYGSDALANALSSAAKSDEPMPDLLEANLADVAENTGTALQSALNEYGAKQYETIEIDGVKVGIFGLMGESAISSAYRSSSKFTDSVKAAKSAVAALKSEGAELIVCLSHGGTSSYSFASADEKLAKKVDGIDVIISGHSHTVLNSPIVVNGTQIVSCGQYGDHLGSLSLKKTSDGWSVSDYSLIDIDSSFAEDEKITEKLNGILSQVNADYMSKYGYTTDEVLTVSPFNFNTGLEYGNNHYNEPLGQLIGDSQRYAISKAEGDDYSYIDVTIVLDAAIRGSIDKGNVTIEEAYDTRSLGYGKDCLSGDPLVTFYLTGKELKYICECDASIAQFSAAAQVYMTGITYTYSEKSLLLSRVSDVYITRDGEKTPIDEKALYRVSTCYYNLDMFKMVGSYTAGAIMIVPKDKSGNEITDYDSLTVYTDTASGKAELKEWLAVAQYLDSFPENSDGVSIVPEYYNNLFIERNETGHADISDYVILILSLAAFIALIVFIVVLCKKTSKKKKAKKIGRV